MSLVVDLTGQRSRDVIGQTVFTANNISTVKTSVDVTSNSPSQDYTHPDDPNLRSYNMHMEHHPARRHRCHLERI